MLSALLKPLVSSWLASAQPQASSAPTVKQAPPPEPILQPAQVASDSGVKFDLSARALEMVDAASAADGSSDSGMAPASASGLQPASQQAPASASTARGAETSARPESLSDTPAPSRTADQSINPTEEERARAWAIRGMDRERLLSLVDTLKVTPKADPAAREVAQHTAGQPHVQASPLPDRVVSA